MHMQQKRVCGPSHILAHVCVLCVYTSKYVYICIHTYTHSTIAEANVWEHSNNFETTCAPPIYVCACYYKNIVCVPEYEYNMCLHMGACASICAGILGVGT